MPESYLLLSSPPHADVNVAGIAPVFELTPAEARVKVNYPAATIWFAGEDLPFLQQVAQKLQSCGASVRLIKGKSLTVLTRRHRFRRFAFDDSGLRCWVDDKRAVDIPFSWSVRIISCRPMATESYQRQTLRQTVKAANRNKSMRQEAKSSLTSIREPVDETFVDFYFAQLPKVHRFTTRPGDTDFSGLGATMKHSVNENIAELIAQLNARFSEVTHNKTLENLPAPRAALIGHRSLGTILDDIEGGLSTMDPYDLMSRLSFLAQAGK